MSWICPCHNLCGQYQYFMYMDGGSRYRSPSLYPPFWVPPFLYPSFLHVKIIERCNTIVRKKTWLRLVSFSVYFVRFRFDWFFFILFGSYRSISIGFFSVCLIRFLPFCLFPFHFVLFGSFRFVSIGLFNFVWFLFILFGSFHFVSIGFLFALYSYPMPACRLNGCNVLFRHWNTWQFNVENF